ncbi:Pkinase-domain-containing protein [Pseudovirgaria hyperparasitica]|uniref:non-specific serine/threonine protein kinase n=1 Tax=Pseudovirgaria hyperparasitica TaxID=470096 RepID=A0A6A6W3D6_9PEZI|nr:Pkinase-domain-containing protein [Pseudovirgaria hyperparasitica]KAF2756107.1 Pkinase-domain-containing protein [Pseudovirgaria hyperparasitica]
MSTLAPMSQPPSASSKTTASPAPSISTSSLQSEDGKFSQLPAAQHPVTSPTSAPSSNGTGAPVSSDSRLQPVRKPTITSRLSNLLVRKDDSSKDATRSNGDSLKSNGDPAPASVARPPPSRAPSVNDKSKAKKDQIQATIRGRFWTAEDGTHEHHLKAGRRQEKLSDMFRELMVGKRKDQPEEQQPLSLMANWADVMRNEKEKLTEQKNLANTSQTLVQKYGKCQEVIGRGAFGVVRISHKQDSKDPKREQLYAVKEFKQRPGESDKKYQKRLTSEFCISSSMAHPNVINTLDLLQDDKGIYCEVMEYCAGGDLYTLILAATQLEVLEADCFFKQLMRGVEYMHEMGVAHRDLKPENLLLTQHGSIKITDFGNGECFRMAWEKEAHMTAGLCGSAPYIAPEEYVDQEFDPRAVDVWACGIIYMAMRTGRHLWRVAQKEEDEFFNKYLEDRREEAGYRPIEVLRRRQCRNVIYSILDPNPTRRLTAHQVLLSEWVKDIKICRAGDEGF